jgi:hypothetical protein
MSSSWIWQILALLVLLQSSPAFAGDFKVALPPAWTLQSRDSQGSVYVNSASSSSERIVVQSFNLQYQPSEFQNDLANKKDELNRVRGKFFSLAGLGNYNILSLGKIKLSGQKFSQMHVIQSRYLNFEGSEVQMLERQYSALGRLYVVTYLVQSGALGDPNRLELLLNRFQPLPSGSRVPSSETLRSDTTKLTSVPEISDAAKQSPVRDLDMKNTDNQKQCERVLGSRSRKAEEQGFLATVEKSMAGENNGSCLLGLVDNVWGLVKGFAELFWSGLKYINPFSGAYRDQVHATVGVIASEIAAGPKKFAMRMASEIYNVAAQGAGDFFNCKTDAEQVRDVCNIAANLIPIGLIGKVILKAPLAAVDVAKASAVVKDVVGTEKLTVVAKAAGDAKPLVESPVPKIRQTEAFSTSVTPGTEKLTVSAARKGGLQKLYGDLLKKTGFDEETFRLLDKLDSLKIDKDKIRNALARSEKMCVVP